MGGSRVRPKRKPEPTPAEPQPVRPTTAILPRGPVETPNPNGQSFGAQWENLHPHYTLIEREATPRGLPIPLVVAVGLIESGWKQAWPSGPNRGKVIEVHDSYGGGPSVGFLQVKPFYWQSLIPGADAYTLAGNVALGCELLKRKIAERGSWQEAIKRDYHPGVSPNGTTPESYVRCITALLAEWDRKAEGDEPKPPTPPPVPIPPKPAPIKRFWMAPWPSGFTRRIVRKPADGDGRGWNSTNAFRGDLLNAIFVHHTAGGPGFDKNACVRLFEGERVYQALTEAVFDRDGTGYLMNDPWSDNPLEGSGRIPWASGPANNLSAAGAAYVRARGANAVNAEGFSAEHCHAAGERWSDAMLDLGAKVYAVILTRRGWDYEAFPRNPKIGNLWAALHHDDIANTTCPNIPADVWTAYIEAIRFEAKRLQVDDSISPPPPIDPTPPEPTIAMPLGLPLARVKAFFGTLKRRMPDGTTKGYTFDPKGSISLSWAKRCDDEGWLPSAHDWWQEPDGRHYISFGRSAGDTDWLLSIASLEGRADWRWVDRPEMVA